jgi:hypothetical protein
LDHWATEQWLNAFVSGKTVISFRSPSKQMEIKYDPTTSQASVTVSQLSEKESS